LEPKKNFSHNLSQRKHADDVFGHSQRDSGELPFITHHPSVAQMPIKKFSSRSLPNFKKK
jgi:hypothetical protein